MAAKEVVTGPQRSEHLAQTTSISFTSKATVKIADTFFSVEFTETRQVPFGANAALEIQSLTDDVNAVVDDQIEQLESAYKGGK